MEAVRYIIYNELIIDNVLQKKFINKKKVFIASAQTIISKTLNINL